MTSIREKDLSPRPSSRRLRCCAVLLTVLSAVHAAPVAASSDSPELITDRPDRTESAAVVPPGLFQLEVGWEVSRQVEEGGPEVRSRQVPASLLRIGLTERFELRLGWGGFIEEEPQGASGPDLDGVGDGELGAKLLIAPERGSRPATALLVGVSVPVGDEGITSDRYDPSVRLALGKDLPGRLALGTNLGVSWETTEEAEGDLDSVASLDVTSALGIDVSPQVGAFVELFGAVPLSGASGVEASFDGGFTFPLGDHLQLDLAGGVGLTDEAPDWFVGAGVSLRLPR